MAKKYIPIGASGAQTPFDNLVGNQTVQGGGLTQGNFEWSYGISEKSNRNFNIGVFQQPVSLEDLNLDSINQSRELLATQYRVYPNFDLSNVTNFTIFGSLQNMSPDEVFSSIKFAKETAIAARNSMNTSVSAIISDSALKKAILDKLDSRINSLSKLDTVYTRMLSDSGVSFNKEYLLEFGKHYQGITSDLIPQKHFKESMNFFNLGGTLPKKFTEYDQQTFAQSSSLKDAILGVSNFYPTKYSTCDESLLQGFHTSVASYMSYSGVGNDTRKSDGWSKS